MSELFLRTLRDDPADAEVPSHKLLIRAGYIRPIGPGLYSWLPLGLRVLRKIERVVRDEMNAIGGQEILFPALLPRAPYETTNRWTEYGDGVFRLQDRRRNDYLLGPTHEEFFTLTVKGEYSCYKDFPLLLFQIQTKYRDEARPRAGILRGREFIMKDSYSFDVDDDGLKAAYHAHREAYQRIFDRLGVRYVIVSAVSGAMGGSASEEFLAESEVGEDTFVRCLESGYAANVEAVITAVPESLPIEGQPEAKVYDTPGTPTIATLVDWANTRPGPRGHRRRHAEERGAQGASARRRTGSCWRSACPATARSTRSGSAPRSTRPSTRCSTTPTSPSTRSWRRAISARKHCWPTVFAISSTRGWSTARRGSPAPTSRASTWSVWSPAATSSPTAPSRPPRSATATRHPTGRARWCRARGIEIGHIFQLGRKYTDAFTADVLGEDGKPVRLTMGSYGIGVSRLVAVIAEQHHDELGLRWPSSVSPFDAHVVIANKDERRPGGRRGAGRRPGPARRRGAARRPAGLARGEVQGRRAARRAVDRRGRPRLGRRRGRAAQPVHRRDPRDPRRQCGRGHLGGRRGKLGFSAILPQRVGRLGSTTLV